MHRTPTEVAQARAPTNRRAGTSTPAHAAQVPAPRPMVAQVPRAHGAPDRCRTGAGCPWRSSPQMSVSPELSREASC
eukprot:12774325-Alexandrium_andersonii.AAC.1